MSMPARIKRDIQQRLQRRKPLTKREEIHAYWKRPDVQGEANRAEDYLNPRGGWARSEFLLRLFDEHGITPSNSVLEIGTNVGRNLKHLHDNGYRDLTGIEISARAIEIMRREYPELADADVREGAAEQILPTFADGQFDVVFTMAVLVHIHPDSDSVIFPSIARACSRRLVVIESEGHVSPRHFDRRYRQVFESVGFRQLAEIPCGPMDVGLVDAYVARVFERIPDESR